MTFDITPIVEAVVAVVCAVVTCVLIPYIKSKTTAEQQKEINAWVKIAVAAAEQIFAGSGRGEEKKEYVVQWLKDRGITVDAEKIDAMIEAAVYELNQGLIPLEGVAIVEGGDTNDGDCQSDRHRPGGDWLHREVVHL